MSDRTFVDTNVLVYLFDRDAPEKQEVARALLAADGVSGRLVVSTQVLQEFYVTVTRKLAQPLTETDAESAVLRLTELSVVHVDAPLVLAAIRLSRRHRLSLWDALILEAAVAADCDRLLSEDLQAGSSISRVRIENPFPVSVGRTRRKGPS